MKKRILAVEDSAVHREILRKVLEDEYDIVEAENGKIALELLKQKKVDL